MVKNKRLEKEQITTASIKKLISVLQSGAINYEQYQQELGLSVSICYSSKSCLGAIKIRAAIREFRKIQ